MKLSIVTPVGGSTKDAHKTVASVRIAARSNPCIDFEHILVLNNGAKFKDVPQVEDNLLRVVEDINPAANRSLARNTGTAMTALESDFVLFLDSGDLLLPDALRQLGREPGAVHSFSSLIMTPSERFLRMAKPEHLIELINPFYIGATWVPTELARKYDFIDGRKEDWKLWVTLRRNGVSFVTFPQINYIYTVRSRADHARRKSLLIKDQLRFYREFLRKNLAVSLVSLVMYFSFQSAWWFTIRRREPDFRRIDHWLAEINLMNRGALNFDRPSIRKCDDP